MSLVAVAALARVTVAEAVRDRILYVLLLFAVGLILLSAVLSNLTLGYAVRIVTDLSFSAISVAGALMAILLGVAAVARELERRTAYPILAKPVGRAAYVIGKYIGVVSTTYLNLLVMMAAATVMIASYSHDGSFQYPVGSYVAALGLTLLRVAIVAAIAVALSTFTSSTVAFIGALGFTIAGHFTAEVRFFLQQSGSELSRHVGEIIYYVAPDFTALDGLSRLLHGETIGGSSLALAAGYGVAYAATMLLLAVLAFSRRDLP